MRSIKQKTTLEKAWRLLETVTPLRSDCGVLCGSRCCQGDAQTGMLLFDGEADIYQNDANFQILRQNGRELLVCGGVCARERRPLSCRIYPLFPLLYERDGQEYIKAVLDPRGMGSCPLIKEKRPPDRRFCRAVERCGKLLAEDPAQYAILQEISGLLLDIIDMGSLL